MMLTNNDPKKYITNEKNRIGRMEEMLNSLRKNETTNIPSTADILEKLLQRWMMNKNQMTWNDIIDGIKQLPGTEEEKKIFALGYMAHVFLVEIQDE